MQAPPPLPVPPRPQPAPFVPTPSLLPGPFILLILLPAIPLLLFSLGARPPDTSALPFSTNELFATTALVTMAAGAVLLIGVWPDAGGQIWRWVKDGDGWHETTEGEGGLAAWGLGWGGKGVAAAVGHRGQGVRPVGHAAGQVKAVPEWIWDARIGRWVHAPPPPVLQPLRPVVVPNTRGIHSLAHRHLNALRDAYPQYYTPRKPRLLPAVLLLALGLFFFVIILGNFLKSAYDSEERGSSESKPTVSGSGGGSSSSADLPSWVVRELRKRKSEKPDETLKRLKSEEKGQRAEAKKKGKEELEKWEKKREKEKEVLKKELGKRKMPLTGLENDKGRKGKDGDEDKKEGESEEKKGLGSKIKKLLLGDKAEKGGGGEGKSGKEGKAAEKGKGPAMELADAGLAAVTLANSGANAQKMADKLKSGG